MKYNKVLKGWEDAKKNIFEGPDCPEHINKLCVENIEKAESEGEAWEILSATIKALNKQKNTATLIVDLNTLSALFEYGYIDSKRNARLAFYELLKSGNTHKVWKVARVLKTIRAQEKKFEHYKFKVD